jgi:hypothetical protein
MVTPRQAPKHKELRRLARTEQQLNKHYFLFNSACPFFPSVNKLIYYSRTYKTSLITWSMACISILDFSVQARKIEAFNGDRTEEH